MARSRKRSKAKVLDNVKREVENKADELVNTIMNIGHKKG